MRTSTNIYKRKDGLYEGRYKNGYKENGSTRYGSVYARNYKDCKQKLEQAESEPRIPIDKKRMVLDELFADYVYRLKKASTVSTYTVLYQAHIAPTFGKMRVAMIQPAMINKMLLEKLQELSEAQIENIKRLFVALLNFAFELKIIAEKVTGIIRIKIPSKKVTILNGEEQNCLENYCFSHPHKITLGILLALYTGIRIGELCALKFYDIDTKAGYLNINKTMIRIKNLETNATTKTKIIVDTPKSDSAIRGIPLPKFLLDLIKQMMVGVNKNAYVLTGSVSSFVEPRNLENQYKKILKNCNIEPINFHALRHTFATNALVKQYYDIKTLSEILGHSDVLMTLRKYVHSNTEIKNAQVKNIDNDFNSRINSGIYAKGIL